MYDAYFGFRERPFQLLPNPAFLFLSKSHEEALAHLLYAVSHGEGFVEISGEVGTGKTTLCRSLLESLGEEVTAAYIFNPRMNAVELLQAIAGEFGVDCKAENTRELLDVLNHFLMTQKVERKKVVLIIDEAQNLTRDVLEQVRLLSNLEMTTSKLLQIILVGQPELVELLNSRDLRQLRQRISLRCRLTPMTFNETRAYVRFRIEKASAGKARVLFTRAALARIYAHSRGIPRLINIACDRALLTAYGAESLRITGAIAREAIGELKVTGAAHPLMTRERMRVSAILLTVALAILIVALYSTGFLEGDRARLGQASLSVQGTLPGEHPESGVPVPQPAVGGRSADAEPAQQDSGEASVSLEELVNFFRVSNRYASRAVGLAVALERWKQDSDFEPRLIYKDDDDAFFRLNAHTRGLSVTPVTGGTALLKSLNLPAILVLRGPEDREPRYLTLTEISGNRFRLRGIGDSGHVDLFAGELERLWSGRAYIVWRNFLNFQGVLPLNASPEAVISLKLLLGDLGFQDLDTSPAYDSATRRAVRTVQSAAGIPVDGLVGPMTTMVLYNNAEIFEIPNLTAGSPN